MADVLNQNDIDALLNAVSDGDVEDDSSQRQIFSRYRKDLESVEIKDYDFKRPERISKDQIRALKTLHEAFARNFGAALSGFLRTIVEVDIVHVEQLTYSEFLSSLPNPTSFNLISAEQLEGPLCLEISPLIIYPIIDRLLGGTNQDLFIPQRSMTLIEQRLIARILDRALQALKEAWEATREIDFRLDEMESNPHIVQIVPPNEVVVVLGFEIKVTNRAGTMGLCIPFNVIEPLMESLNSHQWFNSGRQSRDKRWERRIAGRLADASLDVAGVLAETSMTISELRSLEVGDLITTTKAAATPVVLNVEGIPKYLASIGHVKGQRALKVIRSVEPGDRV